jgi:hypothetical protein
MSKSLPSSGVHTCRTDGAIVVYEHPTSGSLCVAIPLAIDEPVAWRGKFTTVIGKSDGTLNTKNIASLRQAFPAWDGADPGALMDLDTSEVQLEAVCEREEFTPEGGETREVLKVQWLNPVGGSSAMPEATDRKTLSTKWGAKFRAASAPAKAAPAAKPAGAKPTPAAAKPAAAPAKAAAAPAKAAAGGPPSRRPAPAAAARTSDADTVWTDFSAANGSPEDGSAEATELGNRFYDAQDRLFPGKDPLTPEDWGAIATELGV